MISVLAIVESPVSLYTALVFQSYTGEQLQIVLKPQRPLNTNAPKMGEEAPHRLVSEIILSSHDSIGAEV